MSNTIKFMRVFFLTALIAGCMLFQSASPAQGQTATWYLRNSNVAGTWKGESICVGKRTACTNEVVVYRFESVPERTGVFTLFADKVIEGKRVPMYKQEIQVDERSAILTAAPASSPLHGYWEYTIRATGEGISGTFHLASDKTIARRMQMKRVEANRVPAAPERELYAGL